MYMLLLNEQAANWLCLIVYSSIMLEPP